MYLTLGGSMDQVSQATIGGVFKISQINRFCIVKTLLDDTQNFAEHLQ